MNICRFSGLQDGNFNDGIVDNMIPISPEVPDFLSICVNINPKVLTISIEKCPVFQVVNFDSFTGKDQNKSNDYNERKTGRTFTIFKRGR